MLKNHLKVAYRNLLKHRGYSFLNLLGLTIGLAAAIFIWNFVSFEKSYENFHTRADRIYRLPIIFYNQGVYESGDAMNFAPTGPTMKEEFPEVEEFVRITPEYGRVILNYENYYFEEKNVYYADSTLFSVFDYPLIEGDKSSCLTRPNTIVLSLSAAERYFGQKENWYESPVGKTIKFNETTPMTITGIMEDTPENSHIRFGALMSFTTFLSFGNDPNENWGWNDFYTYVLLKEGASQEVFKSKMPDFLKRHKDDDGTGNYEEFLVQPLSDIHLKSNLGYEPSANGDARTVGFLSLIALAVLLIAWVNYINLATARAEERAQEVGVRKVIGASKRSLVFQFLSEATILNFIAVLAAIGLIMAAAPLLNSFIGKEIPISIQNLPLGVLGLPVFIILGSLLSGLYPAFILSSFSPGHTLKGSETKRRRSEWVRKSLVTFQYAISVMLIIGTFIIYKQLKFLQNQDLGFSLDRTLVLNAPGTFSNDSVLIQRYYSFKNELKKIPAISEITSSSAVPGKNFLDLDTHGPLFLVGTDREKGASFTTMRAEDNFIDTYGMKVIAGRGFSKEMKTDDDALIINETALKKFDLSDPESAIGKKVQYWGNQRPIVGVVEDYHHKSFRNAIEPMVLMNSMWGHLYHTVKYSASSNTEVDQLLSQIQTSWKGIFPNIPFHFFFLDEHYNEQYQADQQLGSISALFSFLIIFIACLGLFGLAAYSVSVRTKEIGIRKVLGASAGNIILLFSKGYLWLLLISFVLGIPLSYYLSNNWLNNFSSSISLDPWLFLFPCLMVLLIALFAVSSQSFRAAQANPVESLRKE